MKEKIFPIEECVLFTNIDTSGVNSLLGCIAETQKTYKKNEVVVSQGQAISTVGIVLDGSLNIIKDTYSGERCIIATLSPSDLFGEALACGQIESSPISVIARSNAQILFLSYDKLIASCEKCCSYHNQVIKNMMYILAKKNIGLNTKIDIISKRSIREKIIEFLDNHRKLSTDINIFLSREEMAQYLCVDRSSLSRELSKMRDENIIDYHKNNFKILY